jgi:beta-lactamase superfamily II metal-dependent hydrolase
LHFTILFLVLCGSASGSLADTVYYLDLGTHGSTFVIFRTAPAGGPSVIVVDAGPQSRSDDRGGALLRKFLEEKDVDHIDLLVFSHLHADHAGGYNNLVGRVETWSSIHPPEGKGASCKRGPPHRAQGLGVAAILEPGRDRPDIAQRPLYQIIRKESRARGTKWLTPETADAEVLWQQYCIKIHRIPDPNAGTINDASLVIEYHEGNSQTVHLLTGDMTRKTMEAIEADLPVNIHILTAPHHGGDKILGRLAERTAPHYIVVSANDGNLCECPRSLAFRSVARLTCLGSSAARYPEIFAEYTACLHPADLQFAIPKIGSLWAGSGGDGEATVDFAH